MLPASDPVVEGANCTPIVQWACAARVAVQVLPTNSNPDEAVRERLFKLLRVPPLVMVTVATGLVFPTPVGSKLNTAGVA
jgi:hypothetical protein